MHYDHRLDDLLSTLRLLLRPRDAPGLDDVDLESELEPELESESDPELESESESEPEPEPEPEDDPLRLVRFLEDDASLSPLFASALAFSFAAKILSAVPVFVLNSSGTSTLGCPDAFNLASTFGFSSCCVREGRVTYGLVDLHS